MGRSSAKTGCRLLVTFRQLCLRPSDSGSRKQYVSNATRLDVREWATDRQIPNFVISFKGFATFLKAFQRAPC